MLTRRQASLSGKHDASGSNTYKEESIESGTEDDSNDEPSLAKHLAQASLGKKVMTKSEMASLLKQSWRRPPLQEKVILGMPYGLQHQCRLYLCHLGPV